MQVFARDASRYVPISEVAFVRLFFTLPILTPFMILTGRPLFGRDLKLLFLRGFFGFSSLGLGFFAITVAPLGVVSILWKTSVPLTALLSMVVLKEVVTRRLLGLIALCFLGATLIIKPGFIELNVGTVAALVAGFSVACVSVLIKKLHNTESSLTIIWGFSFWGSLLAFVIFGSEFILPPMQSILPLVLLGFAGLAGQVFFTNAFRFADASTVQPFTYLESVFAFLWGITLFDENPEIFSIVGSALIIFSGYQILRQAKKSVDA